MFPGALASVASRQGLARGERRCQAGRGCDPGETPKPGSARETSRSTSVKNAAALGRDVIEIISPPPGPTGTSAPIRPGGARGCPAGRGDCRCRRRRRRPVRRSRRTPSQGGWGRRAGAFGAGLAEDFIASVVAPSARPVICSPTTLSPWRSWGVTTTGCAPGTAQPPRSGVAVNRSGNKHHWPFGKILLSPERRGWRRPGGVADDQLGRGGGENGAAAAVHALTEEPGGRRAQVVGAWSTLVRLIGALAARVVLS